jgi:hypothetical protein
MIQTALRIAVGRRAWPGARSLRLKLGPIVKGVEMSSQEAGKGCATASAQRGSGSPEPHATAGRESSRRLPDRQSPREASASGISHSRTDARDRFRWPGCRRRR